MCNLFSFELRPFQFSDAEALAQFHVRNRDYFCAYSASREPKYYTVDYQRQLIQQYVTDRYEDSRYTFGIMDTNSHGIIGLVSLSEVIRGPIESAYLGYCMDKAYTNRGIATAAVKQLIQYAFESLQLHRIEAHVMPANVFSQRVLVRNGFVQEGVCRKNIKVNGQWEDHLLFARLDTD